MKYWWRMPLVAGVSWVLLEGLVKVVRVDDFLPIGVHALLLSLFVEALIRLYSYEAGVAGVKRARWVVGLRLGALMVLWWMWLAPVWVRTAEKEEMREVVVLMDDSGSMTIRDEGETETRRAKAERVLQESGLLDRLGKDLKVRVVQAARGVRENGGVEAVDGGWQEATDLAGALGSVLEQVRPDQLAGAVLLSDGRHNRPGRVEDVARRFGILDAPIGVVAMGSEVPPTDAAVAEVDAPEAMHLGDRMRVMARVKFDGMKGRAAKVLLKQGDKVLETREVAVPQDRHQEELRFVIKPEEGGTAGYRVEVEAMEGERFADNNSWEFETSITDDRTHVLLVDAYPRWEFRYLRNLFYGRDQSVHLQSVLLKPDRIDGQVDDEVLASAARPFGEANATTLPVSEEEWRKFDVIILGDLPAGAVSEETWEVIARCVEERGALLVMIAGPRSMPHGLESSVARGLVPAEMEWGGQSYFREEDEPFEWQTTPEGEGHPITQQGEGSAGEMWRGFPKVGWRHPLKSLKEGAEVLLMAGEAEAEVASGVGLDDALGALARRREKEAERALLVARQTGRGKVVLMLTDRTWRLREGIGDLHHHRFWGNLVRWGAGPVLRAGNERVRLGTDQLVYTPDDRVQVRVRLRDEGMGPVFEEGLQAEVRKDGRVVATVPVSPVADSNGLHEGVAGPYREAGEYEVSVGGDGGEEVVAKFRVVGSKGPVEWADVTLNRPLLAAVASLSGGKVVGADAVAELGDLFLGERRKQSEVRETGLWDQWWVLTMVVIFLAMEWVIRRRVGLP